MFLTPAGEPFWGGTYFPPEPRYGRPAFSQVLQALSDAYREQAPPHIETNVTALRQALADHSRPAAGTPITAAALDIAAGAILRMIDGKRGGTQGAPKFPQTALFELLWRAYWRNGDETMGRAAIQTLDHIGQGGIYDHVGGGFARYSTDAEWLVPHFEKMLYDNAGLVDLLTLVWQRTGNPLYAARVEETVGWLLREMIAEHGAFAASLDADSDGEEGLFYIWTKAEIEKLPCRPTRPKLCAKPMPSPPRAIGKATPSFTATIPPAPSTEAKEPLLATARATLLAAREKRVRPGRDDKVLADWNGMMIAALARAALAFGRPDWLAAAMRAFDAVATHMARIDTEGRGAAVPFAAPRPPAGRRHARRLCPNGARRHRALRGDGRDRLSRSRRGLDDHGPRALRRRGRRLFLHRRRCPDPDRAHQVRRSTTPIPRATPRWWRSFARLFHSPGATSIASAPKPRWPPSPASLAATSPPWRRC